MYRTVIGHIMMVKNNETEEMKAERENREEGKGKEGGGKKGTKKRR